MSSTGARQSVATGAYPERMDRAPRSLDRWGARVAGPAVRRVRLSRLRSAQVVAQAGMQELAVRRLSAAGLRNEAGALGPALRREGFGPALVASVFALVREAATRGLGQRHFDVQLLGGHALLAGMVAEMETGEGKTLTATLPACTAALAGVPVHIVTVNDYLAERDAQWMKPIYEALGLTVGVIVHGLSPEARRAAYAADVTYCTNKELAFDYLRDRIVLGPRPSRVHLTLERLYGPEARARRLLLRGLHYAIVDEADSVLIDEARTPLIISGGGHDVTEKHIYETALGLADQLVRDRDFTFEPAERVLQLSPHGMARLAELAQPLGGVWMGRLRREELARQALVARHLFHRDQHYLVQDGKVQIVDEYTGRLMPDRSWEQGLHQLIEVKEGCQLSSRHETLARISYQRFFRRYHRLAGMTGTAREVARELWAVYRLPAVRISTNRPLQRSGFVHRVYPDAEVRWSAVVERVSDLHAEGRPVLLGTRSVAASEHVSRLLEKAGLAHRVLNARQDLEEAQIVAEAGQPGQITVATNMAGRGTDIRLGDGVAERGGLHVIATERHEASRIDRQLFGRCGRQGDPGSYEAMVSLDDELFTTYGRRWRWLAARFRLGDRPLPSRIGEWLSRVAQRAAERRHARMRRDLLRMDEQLEKALAFTGGLE